MRARLANISPLYVIILHPMCSFKSGEQTVDHILYGCKLLDQEIDGLKGVTLRAGNWPVNENGLIIW